MDESVVSLAIQALFAAMTEEQQAQVREHVYAQCSYHDEQILTAEGSAVLDLLRGH